MRVLVVEDERRLADLLARGLREAGHDADACLLADTLSTVGTQPEPAPGDITDLAAIADQAVARHAHIPTEHREPAVALGNTDRLRQVLTNLLDNATRHGRPPVTIRSRPPADCGAATAATTITVLLPPGDRPPDP